MPDDTPPATLRAEVLGDVELPGGHRAELVRMSGPDGKGVAFHRRVLTQTYVSRLHADGVLSPGNARLADDMRDAAQRLADDHALSAAMVGTLRAVDPEHIGGGGSRQSDPIRDERAYARYRAALESLTPMDRRVAIRACIEQHEVALAPLRSALMGLVSWYRMGG